MFDETNKTEEQDIEFAENLSGDEYSEIEDSGIGDHTDAEDEMGGTLRIKYNGEERDITMDEARTLAQKGLNYDHVVAERDTKYRRELDFLDRVAAEQGMTRAQYMASVEGGAAMHNGEDYTTAQSVASQRAAAQIERIRESVGFSGPWGKLFGKYPSLSRENAYAQLSDAVKSGMTPLEAYQAKLLEDKEAELKSARHSNEAARRSVGSLEGDGDGEEPDDFLIGFNSIYD